MKNIMMFSLLAIFISCTVKDTKEDENGGGDKFPAFLESIADLQGVEMLNSSGDKWKMGTVGSFSTLQDETGYDMYIYSKSKSDTTATYKRMDGGTGYIGLEIADKTEKTLYLYKDGTVVPWQEEGDVSFVEVYKVLSSAKGEFIDNMILGSLVFDNTLLLVKDNGDIWLNDALTFTHVKTSDDAKDKAIYKKFDAEEYMGIRTTSIENSTRYATSFYRENPTTPTYFSSKDAVKFTDEYKSAPVDDFFDSIAGDREDLVYYANGQLFKYDVTIKPDGNIVKRGDDEILFRFAGLIDTSKAGYSFKDDSTHLLGLEFSEGKIKLYQDKKAWEKWNIFEYIDIKEANFIYADIFIRANFKNNLKEKVTVEGKEYTIYLENGNLALKPSGTVTYTKEHNYEMDDYEVSITKIVYKVQATGTYVGIDIKKDELYNLYKENGTSAWGAPDSVDFGETHRVAPEGIAFWKTVSDGLSTGASHWPAMISDDDGNIYVSYQDDGASKGFLKKYTKTTGVWSEIGQSTGAIEGNALAISEDGNIYWTYHLTSDDLLHVQKYDGSTLSPLGDGGSTAIAATKIETGHFADIATYNNEVYIIGKNDANGSSVYKYNDTDDAWELHGPKEAFPAFGTTGGMKKIAINSTGKVYVVVHGSENKETEAPVYTRFLKDGNTWQTIGYPDVGGLNGAITGKGRYPSIAIDSSDKVHVSYRNGWKNNQATVKTWAEDETEYDNGNNWVALAPEGFGANSRHTDVAFYADDTPIASFGGDPDNAQETFVYTHTGSWVKVGGTASVSDGFADYTTLAVDPDDTVYVAYHDRKKGKLVIKKNTLITTP